MGGILDIFKKAGQRALTREEAEAIQDLMGVGGKAVKSEVDNARQIALQETFDGAPKSAMESMDTFQKAGDPNFSLVGEPTTPKQLPALTPGTGMAGIKPEPNFETVGKPYGNDFTMPESPSQLPAVAGKSGMPMAGKQSDNVIDAEFRSVPVDLDAAKSGAGLDNLAGSGKGLNPYLLGTGTAVGGAGVLASTMPKPPGTPGGPLQAEERGVATENTPAAKPEESALSRLQALLKPRGTSMKNMDFGNIESGNTVDGLKEAQGKRDEVAMVNNLGRASELIGSGISGAKPVAQNLFTEQAKSGERFVKDFKDAGEQEKNDPNSGVSKAYRKAMERFGVKVQGNPSAATMEKVAPWIVRAFEGDENRAARKDAMAMHAASREDAAKVKGEQRKDEHALRMAPKVQNKQYEKYVALRTASKLVEEAMQNPNPQTDIGIVYNFVKALDPESVVKEGEIKFSQAARGIPDQVKGLLEKAYSGQILTPQERKNIFAFTQSAKELGRREWDASAGPYINQAKKQGIDLSTIIPELQEDGPAKKQAGNAPVGKESPKAGKTAVKKGYNSKTNQTQVIYSDGSKEILEGKQ